ncbi:MAG: hypothetical protein L0H26_05320, partial [Microlunatus sp.]|nr:hypothetical protein [Microlunatus sp.]
TVPGYRPVTGPVLTSMSRDEAAHSLADLVRDADHQARQRIGPHRRTAHLQGLTARVTPGLPWAHGEDDPRW